MCAHDSNYNNKYLAKIIRGIVTIDKSIVFSLLLKINKNLGILIC